MSTLTFNQTQDLETYLTYAKPGELKPVYATYVREIAKDESLLGKSVDDMRKILLDAIKNKKVAKELHSAINESEEPYRKLKYVKLFEEWSGKSTEVPIGKVGGFNLIYQTFSKMMGGNGVAGTIRTSPANYYVATIDEAGKIKFDGLEANTKDIDREAVKALYDKHRAKQTEGVVEVHVSSKQSGGRQVSEGKDENPFKFQIYHNTYSSAVKEVKDHLDRHKANYKMQDLDAAYLDAFFKPKEGKTKKDHFPIYNSKGEDTNMLEVQIYNRGEGKFELNMYFQSPLKKSETGDHDMLRAYDEKK